MSTTVKQPEQEIAAAEELDPRRVGIQYEAKLRDWLIPYTYVAEFPVADVENVPWTQVRQAAGHLNKDTVSEYRTQMAQGAVFPPIVIMQPNVLVDGNTRLAAAKGLRRKTIPAFVVQFNSVDLAKTFAAAMNMMGGVRLTPDEAYEAALTMMRRGMADEAVAREIGRSVEATRQMRRRKEFAERSAALPELTNLAGKVRQSQQVKLAQITHDPVFVEAVKIAAETNASEKDISNIVKAATTARSDREAVEAVHAIRAELAPAGPPPIRVTIPPEAKTARMQIGGLDKLRADPPALLIPNLTPEARAEAGAQCRRVGDLAYALADLYGDERS